MEAKDGSMGFDFEGKFTKIVPHKSIHFDLGDGRVVSVDFVDTANGVQVRESFEADDVYSAEQQKNGWQNILNNFKKHVESKGN